jgi:molybdate/tungstate transport system substrate-binding protein
MLAIAFCLCGMVLAGAGASGAESSGELKIFHAGSLSVPFGEMEKAFEAKHPGIDVQREGGGSTKMARMISEVGKPADIMASADYVVIDKNLIPKFATWNARFASNRMVLCYTADSRYADEINGENWYEVLQRDGVSWGHSDPDLDPCGYRSLMVLQLAEKFYDKPGLYRNLLANRPEKNIRPKSVELISLLQSGNMDYAWEYRSVAVQHDLRFVELDDHINLGNYRMDPFYKQAKVEVAGKKPGETVTRTGKSITYGVTMIDDAPNPEAAELFLSYLFDPDGGLAILDKMGQPPFEPVRVPTGDMKQAMPGQLQSLVEVRE